MVTSEFYDHFKVFNSFKAYHERYTKFKMDCELHLGALRRRESEQEKCARFVEQSEQASNELMSILKRIQADDWSNEHKDVNQAERDFEVRNY